MIESLSLKEQAGKLPHNPGVYIMKNRYDEIIYIGKAKNLKNRVSSYFISDSNHSEKVKKMVENISYFQYIVTDSEFEALVLECSLIKKHQPKYNILLKDGKGYSYIKVTKEKWPRILYTKQKSTDDDIYFGPYMNSLSVKKTVDEINKIFKLPTCNRNLNKKYKRPCLDYYINKCNAPCTGFIDNKSYNSSIADAIKFIKVGSAETIKYLNDKMKKYSDEMNFEKAAEIRDTIKLIKNIKLSQKVVSYKVKEQDIIACATDDKEASFEVFKFQNGDLYETENFIIDLQDDLQVTRTEFIKNYYEMKNSVPKVIVLDGEIDNLDLIKKFLSEKKQKSVEIVFPERGEQYHLVQMCKNNAYENLIKNKKNSTANEDILEDLKNILSLKEKPLYIEAYDISNLKNSDNVGVEVVFKNAKPFKSAYKKFKIKNFATQNDYGSMQEVLERRFKNYICDSKDSGFKTLPDLILIDGGKGHVAAAKEVLKKFEINIPVYGMVKNNSHKTRALTSDSTEIEIKNNSRIFNFITRIQDEVHRFAIGYHRNLRSKNIKSSKLTEIPGVGESRAKNLLKYFGTINAISNAPESELLKVKSITSSIAKNIYNYFNKNP
ncbi:MAG: excinuclease ABC subunit UvrC [Acutalibacteraceae bacterium]